MTHRKDVATWADIMAMPLDQIPKGDPFARGIGPVDPLRERAMNGALAGVSSPDLVKRVRELEERLLTAEERLEQRTRERDHERALLECAPWATYSEGATLLRAQAAEAQQLAKQMMDERDALAVIIKRAHGALADAGDVPVPELHEPIDETIRAIVRERDEERMRTRCLEQTLAETQADLRELKKATP